MQCIFTESCVGRCGSFNPRTKCQCDYMCLYYGSCCGDFDTVCPKKSQCTSRNMSHLYISHHKSELIRRFFFFFHATQLLPPVSRGDTFTEVDEVPEATATPQAATTVAPTLGTLAATAPTTPLPAPNSGPTLQPVDADAAPCSGRPFDAFLQLKNTSIYAFRGKRRVQIYGEKEIVAHTD